MRHDLPADDALNLDTDGQELPFVYQRIKEKLLSGLGTRWPEGSRLPPVPQLAAELNAGKSNTHRALKELVSEGLLVARPGRGTYIRRAGRPSAEARGSRAGASARPAPVSLRGRRAVIVRNMADGFVFPAVDAAAEALSAIGCLVRYEDYRFGISGRYPDDDAVIVINPNGTPHLEVRPDQVVVVISTAMEVPLAPSCRADAVIADSHQGGYLAGEHLRQIGCRSVYFIGVYPKSIGKQIGMTTEARLRGFEEGFGHAVPASAKYLANCYQVGQGARAVAKYMSLDPRPQAVFAVSDEIALGFIYGALSHGLEPGRDYQLIGFDGQLRGRDAAAGARLTTVEVPMHHMGTMAARLLVERLRDPRLPARRLLVANELYVGGTTAAASAAKSSE